MLDFLPLRVATPISNRAGYFFNWWTGCFSENILPVRLVKNGLCGPGVIKKLFYKSCKCPLKVKTKMKYLFNKQL